MIHRVILTGGCLLEKAPDAFRTISEVADDLDIPAHVLRFWETRFVQIKPMKRSGGRRYYRPDDVELLRGIRRLLYGEGYTIRGVQRILREHGIKAVQNLDEAALAPAALSGSSFDTVSRHDAKFHADEEDVLEAEADEIDDDAETDEEVDEVEIETDSPPLRPSMDFVPSMSERIGPMPPAAEKRAPEVPVATVAMPTTAMRASAHHNGADAYAPPGVRNGLHQSALPQSRGRGNGQAKLRSVLDDLLGARALLDRAMKSEQA
jgi:DNA-binding transcriptional MerR regulator